MTKRVGGVIAILALIGTVGFFLLRSVSGGHNGVREVVTPDGKALSLTIADSPQERAKGLGGYEALSSDAGMLFLFDKPTQPTFWMKEMLIPIDIIWIGLDGRVIGVEEGVLPPKTPQETLPLYPAPEPIMAVLEVFAGQSETLGIVSGTNLSEWFSDSLKNSSSDHRAIR